jgi:Tfp pilus assembly protein PilX
VAVIIIALVGMVVVALLALAGVFEAWRRERQQVHRLADRLATEARLEALTVATLQSMHAAARSGAVPHHRPAGDGVDAFAVGGPPDARH